MGTGLGQKFLQRRFMVTKKYTKELYAISYPGNATPNPKEEVLLGRSGRSETSSKGAEQSGPV